MVQVLSTYLLLFIKYLITLCIFLQSQKLALAAYNSDWVPQSESYKRSIRLFIGRANSPIVIAGLKVMPLSLGTFISVSIIRFT